jgi:hypothetical protein
MTVKIGASKIVERTSLNETGFRYLPSVSQTILPESKKLVDIFFGREIEYEERETVKKVAAALKALPRQARFQNKVREEKGDREGRERKKKGDREGRERKREGDRVRGTRDGEEGRCCS